MAGLLKAAKQGKIIPESTAVCVLTGNGLKDPTTAMQQVELDEKLTYKADTDQIAEALDLS